MLNNPQQCSIILSNAQKCSAILKNLLLSRYLENSDLAGIVGLNSMFSLVFSKIKFIWYTESCVNARLLLIPMRLWGSNCGLMLKDQRQPPKRSRHRSRKWKQRRPQKLPQLVANHPPMSDFYSSCNISEINQLLA